jgi:hypothetical protein
MQINPQPDEMISPSKKTYSPENKSKLHLEVEKQTISKLGNLYQ